MAESCVTYVRVVDQVVWGLGSREGPTLLRMLLDALSH